MKTDSHFYTAQGHPAYEVPYADPSKGMRKATLADAKKHDWLPSVTTITRTLAAPNLVEYFRRQMFEAVATTPRSDGWTDEQYYDACCQWAEEHSEKAKQLGTDIHALIQNVLEGDLSLLDSNPLSDYGRPAIVACRATGCVRETEKIVIGDGYGGKVDCITETDGLITVIDFKTTGSNVLPKKSYFEHRMQTAAYAMALGNTGDRRIQTCNIYISTVRPGEISVCRQEDWEDAANAFILCMELWQSVNDYTPNPLTKAK